MTTVEAPDIMAQLERIDRLAAAGEDGVPTLIDWLSAPNWRVRRAVVAALAALGDAAAPRLCELLRDRRDDETRLAALVDALVASISKIDELILPLTHDANPAVVADAAQILGRRRAAASVPLLTRLAAHADDNVALSAIEALGRIGGRAAIDALVAAIGSRSFFRTFPAIDVLGRSGDPRAVSPLAGLLGNPQYALEAARALGKTGDRGAVVPLLALLTLPSDTTVRVGAMALADLRRKYAERFGAADAIESTLHACVGTNAVRRLTQCLTGADVNEQVAICSVLGAAANSAAAPALTRLLDASPVVALAASEALRCLGRESDVHIGRALRDGDSERRRVLLPIVTYAAAADEVVRCLNDVDPLVRALACDTLARLGNPAVVPALFEMLADPNPRVSQAAVGAIQSLGHADTRELATAAAVSPIPLVRRAALRVLAYFGYSEVLELFKAALQDSDPRVRDAAIQGLPFLDDPRAIDLLLQTGRDETPRTRGASMRALGQCGEDVRVAASLLRGLKDEDAWVRYYACQSLGRLGYEDAAESIARLLADEAGHVRVAAVEALSHLESAVALGALKQAVASAEPDIHRAALIGLGLRRALETLPILLAAAASEEPATRLVALSAMADFPSRAVDEALFSAATDPDENVRTAAIGFLGARSGAEATRLLIHLLITSSERGLVSRALSVAAEGRVTGILAALDTADDELATELASVLVRLDRADATAALFEAMLLPNVAARKAAASTLAALGTRDAFTALQRAAHHDSDPEVRRVCALLLAN